MLRKVTLWELAETSRSIAPRSVRRNPSSCHEKGKGPTAPNQGSRPVFAKKDTMQSAAYQSDHPVTPVHPLFLVGCKKRSQDQTVAYLVHLQRNSGEPSLALQKVDMGRARLGWVGQDANEQAGTEPKARRLLLAKPRSIISLCCRTHG